MSPYERYQATLHRRPVDFLPRTPILMQFAAEYIGSDYAAFASDYRVLVEANLRCAQDFGIDQVSCISDPYRETQGFGATITYLQDGAPRATQPLGESKDLDALPRPDPHTSERMRDRLRAVEAYRKHAGDRYSVLGWVEGPAAEAADLRGVINFLFDVVDDPDFAGALMDRCVETGIEFACAQVEAGCDTIGIGDALASQLSTRVYESLVLPRERRLVRAIKSAGAHVKLHICGKTSHLLRGIATLGVDIVDLDHMVDMREARQVLGPKVALTGNLDPVDAVRFGTAESIRRTLLEIYESVGSPYMVNAGCEIPSGTPMENLKALCDPITTTDRSRRQ